MRNVRSHLVLPLYLFPINDFGPCGTNGNVKYVKSIDGNTDFASDKIVSMLRNHDSQYVFPILFSFPFPGNFSGVWINFKLNAINANVHHCIYVYEIKILDRNFMTQQHMLHMPIPLVIPQDVLKVLLTKTNTTTHIIELWCKILYRITLTKTSC